MPLQELLREFDAPSAQRHEVRSEDRGRYGHVVYLFGQDSRRGDGDGAGDRTTRARHAGGGPDPRDDAERGGVDGLAGSRWLGGGEEIRRSDRGGGRSARDIGELQRVKFVMKGGRVLGTISGDELSEQ